MKIDVEVKFLPKCRGDVSAKPGQIEKVVVDLDYPETFYEIELAAEEELYAKYGVSLYARRDFDVANRADVEEAAFGRSGE